MKILIACEKSGVIRNEFNKLGHFARSCDLEPSETAGPHYRGSVFDILDYGWDMMICHPPCVHLAVSGARHFAAKRADGRQQKALEFVERLWAADIPHVCLENPVSIISTQTSLGKCTQVIQPYQFGHPESKRTCLWLRGLPKLQPTNVLSLPECGYWDNQTPSGQNKLGPSKDRSAKRAKTYQGIAEAMAFQWGTKQIFSCS